LFISNFLTLSKEFYFGGGICQGIPGKTPYGNPIKTIELGNTQIPPDLF